MLVRKELIMSIDMTNFKMIYKEQVYNCLSMMVGWECNEPGKPKVKFLEVVYINSDNRVEMVNDEAFMFQFISR
jgi:hypothetical protein